MDFTTLESLIQAGVGNNDFALDTSTLDSDNINTTSGDFFPEGVLSLTTVTLTSDSASSTVTVTGTGKDLPFIGMSVDVTFTLVSDQAEFSMVGTVGDDWEMDSSFPLFTDTIGEDLAFSSDSTLSLISEESLGTVGMTMDSELDLASTTGGLSNLFPNITISPSGSVVLQDNGASLESLSWATQSGVDVDLSIIKIKSLLVSVDCRMVFDPLRSVYDALPYLGMAGKLKFTGNGTTTKLPISVKLVELTDEVRFELDLTNSVDALLSDMGALINNINLLDYVPSDANFALSDAIQMDEFFVEYDTNSEQVLQAGLGMQSTNPWTIFQSSGDGTSWTAQNLSLRCRVFDPMNNSSVTMAVEGEIAFSGNDTFNGTTLCMSCNYSHSNNSNWDIQVYLKEDSALGLQAILSSFIGSGAADYVPDIEVDVFNFQQSYTDGGSDNNSDYSLAVTLSSSWVFATLGLSINQLSLSMGSSENTSIAGLFSIAGVDVSITAEYPGEDEGWDFSGETGAGQAIPIGDLIGDLVSAFDDRFQLPAVLSGTTVKNLKVSFNTKSYDFEFECEIDFTVDDQAVEMTLTISCTQNVGGTYTTTISGHIAIDSLQFDLTFSGDNTAQSFIAAFHQDGGTSKNDSTPILIYSLMDAVSTNVSSYIPDGLSLTLVDALFFYSRTVDGDDNQTSSKFLFTLDVDSGINLSNLPLVGEVLPDDETIGVENLQLMVAFEAFSKDEVSALNDMLPEGVTALPSRDLSEGLNATANMQFGDFSELLNLNISSDPDSANPPTSSSTSDNDDDSSVPSTESDGTLWYQVQKSFGPVEFDRVGVRYEDEALWFVLDASMSSLGLTLSLEGLAMGSPLSNFNPEFDLDGLGVNYDSSGFEIGGAFLHTQVDGGDEYDGAAVLKMDDFYLGAMGSYADDDIGTSMFVYAMLDYPIGGPSFFFVTGLTAGFGYNRKLITPDVSGVADFPLVDEAINGTGDVNDLMGELAKLTDGGYLTQSPGDEFFALGVKFTSFKLIDSFALFMFLGGDHPQIQVLGLSEVVVPTPDPSGEESTTPIAEIQIELKGVIDPEEGMLGIQGQLTSDSYIISKDCQLTGGYAFYSWLSGDHAGDFVQTAGGYHPDFDVPDYYPVVPRMGFNWKLDSHTSIEGQSYYALTGHALMAGGCLKATWESGNLSANFNAGADFLISWKPYHYDAQVSISVGVAYTIKINLGFTSIHKTFKADLGVGLHLWGPDFAGKAYIDWYIISFSISFGSSSSKDPEPIDWDTFKSSFLPETICSVAANSGLLQTVDGTDDSGNAVEIWIVNPNQFSITTNSVIPSKSATYNGSDEDVTSMNLVVGIGSMEVAPDDFTSAHIITIEQKDEESGDFGTPISEFTLVPVAKDVPAGLWGTSLIPEVNSDSLITGTMSGFEVVPAVPASPGVSADIERSDLQFNIDSHDDAYTWESVASFVAQDLDESSRDTAINNTIEDTSVVTTRNNLLSALGFDSSAVDVTASIVDDFLIAPQVEVTT